MVDTNVIIAGGGTGGHLIPGIALHENLIQKGIDAYLLIGKRDCENSLLEEINKDLILKYSASMFSLNILKLLQFVKNFILSFLSAIFLIKKYKINAVIGMGGYVSAPALLAGVFLKVPIYLCEQNTVPGKVTALFAKYSVNIFTTFDASKDYFKEEILSRIVLTGNPLRKGVINGVSKIEAKTFFNLKHCSKVVLVIGGSQGAKQINELILDIEKSFSRELKDIGIIWSTGKLSYQKISEEIRDVKWTSSIYLSPFIEKVGHAYIASDIAISRSGAGAMMELAAAGLPSILIPYPYAADNHQEKNAEVFHNAGAAVKIDREDINPEKVGKKLIDILNNPGLLTNMSDKALSAAKINASEGIVNKVLEDIR